MQENTPLFTAGQFAKIHRINKKTLHYYDEIGLFSPVQKNDKGYRYYSYKQSIELEFILALREAEISIEDIMQYYKKPTSENLIEMTDDKINDIDLKIKRLLQIKEMLRTKKDMISLSSNITDGQIDIIKCEKQAMVLTPFSTEINDANDIHVLLKHLHTVEDLSTLKYIAGTYISLDKVRKHDFSKYDGFFSMINVKSHNGNIVFRPEGQYLRGFCIGDWSKIPDFYDKMLKYAQDKGLILSGSSYEIGLNEIDVFSNDKYVTQILIHCQK